MGNQTNEESVRDSSSQTGADMTEDSTSQTAKTAPADMLDPDDTNASEGVSSVDEQIQKVKDLSGAPLEDEQEGYVVSYGWLKRVNARSSESQKSGAKRAEDNGDLGNEIGPIDNLDIVATKDSEPVDDMSGRPFLPLKPGLAIGEDYEIFPLEAWQSMVKWYGIASGSPTITRTVHNTNPNGEIPNLQYETYPPVISIHKLRNDSRGFDSDLLRDAQAECVTCVCSRFYSFNKFLKVVKEKANLQMDSKVRVWRILKEDRTGKTSGIITPAASRSTSPIQRPDSVATGTIGRKLIVDVNTFLSLEYGSQRELLEVQDHTANEKYNGRMTLSLAGLGQDESIVLEERLSGPAGGDWISEVASKGISHAGALGGPAKDSMLSVPSKTKGALSTSSGRSSPARSARGMTTRGRAQRSGRTLGTCGLSNLGNTCYMNSALQCVRSVEELTQYFRLNKHVKDLNPSNPLSYNGDIATSYSSLLAQMFAPNSPTSISPSKFRNVIGRYGPAFSGFGQQDSQEFLGFLLDGLQEDLNRILKKPYIEKPDSTDEMVHNPKALRELADKCWDIYKARNDSVIADLFAGTYKSTLVCPECRKVSITFDPFNTLTLQLPIENVWSHEVYYFGLNQTPIRISVDMDKNGSIKALKEYVATKAKADTRRLHAAEIYQSKIYKAYDDYNSVSESIQSGDDVAIFELDTIPTNSPPPKRKTQRIRSMLSYWSAPEEEDEVPEGDSALGESLLVPIFNRIPKETYSRQPSCTLFGAPQYIVVKKDEASSYDIILRKLLSKVDTMTTFDLFQDLDGANGENNDSSSQDEDGMIVTSSEDNDSVSGAKVQDQSVDGEDGIVDISMKDAGEGTTPLPSQLAKDQMHKSKFLKGNGPLPSHLKDLFTVRVFSQPGQVIPTGWSANIDEQGNFPEMESRLPQKRQRNPSIRMKDQTSRFDDDVESSSDAEIDDPPQQINRNLAAHDSDSSDDLAASHTPSQIRNRVGKTNSSSESLSSAESSRDAAPDGPLIRLGEGILLDWKPEAYSTLFSGTGAADEMRGAPTWESIELLPDEELKQKRAMRQTRRRKGVSLTDCLDEFNKEEILSEADSWYCPRCKEHRRASKKFELWKTPDILVMHLKRFSASRGLRDKLDVLVDFPIEGLDLENRVALKEDGQSQVYDLFAVDNHYGGLGGGHYTACARNFVDGNWYDYNDTMVSRKSPEQAVSPAAYLLFYRRRSDKPLGGPEFERIVEQANQGPEESEASSRESSPSGEGTGLGGPLGTGSPSASQEAAAEPQAGVVAGALQQRQRGAGYSRGIGSSQTTGSDDEQLPPYLDGGDNHPSLGRSPMGLDQTWSFPDPSSQMGAMPPSPDNDNAEDYLEGLSERAANGSESGNVSDSNDRMADFDDDDDNDGVANALDLPRDRGEKSNDGEKDNTEYSEQPILEVKLPEESGSPEQSHGDDNEEVAEVHVEEGEGLGAK